MTGDTLFRLRGFEDKEPAKATGLLAREWHRAAGCRETVETFSTDSLERYCNQHRLVLAFGCVLGTGSQLPLTSAPHAGRADPRCGP
jgi:hypothetical protein